MSTPAFSLRIQRRERGSSQINLEEIYKKNGEDCRFDTKAEAIEEGDYLTSMWTLGSEEYEYDYKIVPAKKERKIKMAEKWEFPEELKEYWKDFKSIECAERVMNQESKPIDGYYNHDDVVQETIAAQILLLIFLLNNGLLAKIPEYCGRTIGTDGVMRSDCDGRELEGSSVTLKKPCPFCGKPIMKVKNQMQEADNE